MQEKTFYGAIGLPHGMGTEDDGGGQGGPYE